MPLLAWDWVFYRQTKKWFGICFCRRVVHSDTLQMILESLSTTTRTPSATMNEWMKASEVALRFRGNLVLPIFFQPICCNLFYGYRLHPHEHQYSLSRSIFCLLQRLQFLISCIFHSRIVWKPHWITATKPFYVRMSFFFLNKVLFQEGGSSRCRADLIGLGVFKLKHHRFKNRFSRSMLIADWKVSLKW